MRTVTRCLAFAVLTAATVTSCVSNTGQGTQHVSSGSDSTPSASDTSTVVAARSYSTVTELKDAATTAGFPCDQWQLTLEKLVDAAEAGTCDAGVGDVSLATYTGTEARDRQVGVYRRYSVTLPVGTGVLVGPNWSILAPSTELTKLADDLGGVVVSLAG